MDTERYFMRLPIELNVLQEKLYDKLDENQKEDIKRIVINLNVYEGCHEVGLVYKDNSLMVALMTENGLTDFKEVQKDNKNGK